MPRIRPSPSESATLFSVGTRRKGGNKNMWKVITTKNGIKRWRRIQSKPAPRKRASTRRRRRRRSQFYHAQMKEARTTGHLKLENTLSYAPKTWLTDSDWIVTTYDNGARPFRVVANKLGIFVYTYRGDEEKKRL